MAEGNKDEGVGDPFKMLLEESLKWQSNEMMDNFSQILRRVSVGEAPSSNSRFKYAAPFKVQVNFEIPIFEGQIETDSLDIWLNLLEIYWSIIFMIGKILLFHSSKSPHNVKD